MKKLFKWWEVLLILAFFTGLIFIGATKDLEIAKMVFRPKSQFGNIFKLIGFMPSPIMAGAGAMMLHMAKGANKNKFYSFMRFVMMVGACVFAYYYVMDEMYENTTNFWYCALGALIVAISMFITYLLCKKSDKKLIARVGFMLVFTVAIETGLIGVICKHFFARPRYCFVKKTSVDNFRNFWEFDSELKNLYLLNGFDESEFQSFPSGHASGAMCLSLLCTVPLFKNNNKSGRLYLFIGIVFGLLVSYSRMVIGDHFLSDVSVGCLITLVCEIITYYIFVNPYLKKK